jgi:hypothetical protein
MAQYSYGVTNVNPLGLLFLIILGIAAIAVPRAKALLPVIILSCIIPSGQRIVIAGFDFNFIRLMVVFGWIRIIARNEQAGFKLELIDKLMLAWSASKIVLNTIQNHGQGSATVYQLGNAFEALGIYFMARVLVRSIEDVKNISKVIVFLSFPIGAFFLFEGRTGYDPFGVFGGVPLVSEVRDGRIRAAGAFSHPILAGSYFASCIPFVVMYIKRDHKIKMLPVLGVFCILGIIFFCASSTPVMGVMFAATGIFFYKYRNEMKKVRKYLLIVLVALQASMNKPIWHLLARIDLTGSSTGYYRYLLIDAAVANFKQWALVGVSSTRSWSGRGGETLTDIVNQYILEGTEGGLLTLGFFLGVIIVCFSIVGKVIKSGKLDYNGELLAWALGASLFTHCMMFNVVSYFGQITMLWNLLLGTIGSIGTAYLVSAKSRTEEAPALAMPDLRGLEGARSGS